MRSIVLLCLLAAPAGAQAQKLEVMNDVHVHLTNYVQEGIEVRALLAVMGERVSRAALFGIPLQQQWSYANSGDFAPWYYLQTDAPLYYYSFTDAQIAMAYRSLPPALQARFDPMITGFNPADMYAADHIRRVLTIFPGVFSGIGEFTVHKEFVSSKVAGEVASLKNPALDRIFELAAEVGLPVLLHCDADVPFPKPDQEPYLLPQLRDLILRHPKTTVIWAHGGVGRIVHPVANHLAMLERALTKGPPSLFIDLSWDETAKYVTQNAQTVEAVARLINAHPDRFLFGTDEVAPSDQISYLKVYEQYRPLLERLTPEARAGFLRKNYERIFDKARRDVRAWEAKNVQRSRPAPKRAPVSGDAPTW
jgi:predicted TIM-barrel fold metal-dependent hydrolase